MDILNLLIVFGVDTSDLLTGATLDEALLDQRLRSAAEGLQARAESALGLQPTSRQEMEPWRPHLPVATATAPRAPEEMPAAFWLAAEVAAAVAFSSGEPLLSDAPM